MHVLYVIDSLVAAGAERSLAAMAPHLVAQGIRLDVAHLDPRPGLQEELRLGGATLFPIGKSGGRFGQVRRLRRLIAERHHDLVHTTLFEADITGRTAATLARVPVVSSLVNVAYGAEQLSDSSLRSWKVRAAQTLDSLTARRVTRFHAISRHVADVMGDRLHISENRIDVIPRGRNPDELGRRTPERAARARASLGVEDDVPIVLAAGRHEFQKGLDLLLDAFPLVLREFPRAHLFVAGREGNVSPEIRRMASDRRLQNKVDLLGARADLPELLCAAHVFVLPSRWEGFGGVLLEAMALQAPIVASNLPPIRETVTDGLHALLTTPGDSLSLGEGLAASLRDPRSAKQRARLACQHFLDSFNISRVTEAMIAFYRRALGA